MLYINVMRNSFCIWTEVDALEVENLKPDFQSQYGSQYFYSKEGVFRLADHWGRTASSKWRLIPLKNSDGKIKCGYAKFTDFHPDSLDEKCYFIEVDFEHLKVFFNHVNNKDESCQAMLRTSSETTKTIRKIRHLIENQSWTKHFNDENILQKVIRELINTNQTLIDIRQRFL